MRWRAAADDPPKGPRVPEGNALVLHAGGPTAVLNASLAGVEGGCREFGVRRLYGAVGGVAGLLGGSLAELSYPQARWEEIARAPGSLLGSSRRNLTAADFGAVFDVFRRRDIRYLFPTGGNGTMGLALAIVEAARAASFELSVVAIPKTIDNDIEGTDHTPGYASAARFFAFTLRDIGADNRALPGVTVVEILGRNAGWIAAAAILARQHPDDAPHLIYVPERRLPFERLAGDAERIYRKYGRAVIAVCEGQLDDRGEPFGADTRQTGTTPPLAMNLAHVLAQRLSGALGVKARGEKPGLAGRCGSALVSEVDRAEARTCGRDAVRAAVAGVTGCMAAIERAPGAEYRSRTALAPLAGAAGRERLLPEMFRPESAEDDLAEFRKWVEPLVGPVPQLPLL